MTTVDDITSPEKIRRIQVLNDHLRKFFTGGKIMLTSGVAELDDAKKADVLNAMRLFSKFNAANDPHSEHDCAIFEVDGERYMIKIDYYDRDIRYGAADPSDAKTTTRVLTLMLASEY
jgi:hypothetical protein